MWSAYVKSLVILFTRPSILVVPLVCTLLGLAGVGVVWDRGVSDAVVGVLAGEWPNAPLLEWPAFVWGMYSGAVVWGGLALFWFVFVQLVAGYWVSDMVVGIVKTKKSSLVESGWRTIAQTPRLFYITCAMAIAALAGLGLVAALAGFVESSLVLVFLLLAIFGLGSVFLAVKFAFVVPALVAEKGNLTEALKASYEFSNRAFFSALAFIIVLSIASQLIGAIGNVLAGGFAEEEIALLFLLVFYVIGSAFVTASGAFWFFEKRVPA